MIVPDLIGQGGSKSWQGSPFSYSLLHQYERLQLVLEKHAARSRAPLAAAHGKDAPDSATRPLPLAIGAHSYGCLHGFFYAHQSSFPRSAPGPPVWHVARMICYDPMSFGLLDNHRQVKGDGDLINNSPSPVIDVDSPRRKELRAAAQAGWEKTHTSLKQLDAALKNGSSEGIEQVAGVLMGSWGALPGSSGGAASGSGWARIPAEIRRRLSLQILLDARAIAGSADNVLSRSTLATPLGNLEKLALVHGSESPELVKVVCALIREFCAPHATVTEVPGLGHMGPLTHAGMINKLFYDFLCGPPSCKQNG